MNTREDIYATELSQEELQKVAEIKSRPLRRQAIQDLVISKRYFSFQANLNLVNLENQNIFKRLYGKFLIYTASDWFNLIPYLQWSGYLLQRLTRLMLYELISTNKIQGTKGWWSSLVKCALTTWIHSPVELHPSMEPLALVDSIGDKCCYCEAERKCMVKGCETTKKMKCHIESGLHLCALHGKLIFKGTFTTTLQLDNNKYIFSLARAEWADTVGLSLEQSITVPFDYQLQPLGESVLVSPKDQAFISYPSIDDDLLLQIRSHLIQLRQQDTPWCFWDFETVSPLL